MLQNLVRPIYNGLIDLIYPRTCLLCANLLHPSEPQGLLCAKCLNSLSRNHPAFCAKCSRPITSKHQKFCQHCSKYPLQFDRSWSALIYDDTLRHLIHLFKYGKNTGLRHNFAKILYLFLNKYHIPIHEFDMIVPVPLHPARFRERGFNQSELVAQLLAQYLKIPCYTKLLERTHYTPYQARLNPKQRWTNMQGNFKIKKSFLNTNINIIIVDDILTTGATLSEVARELKNSGVNKVYGLTVGIAI